MTVGECLKIAVTNVRIAKSMSIKMMIGLSVTVMILFCMNIYFLTFYKQIYMFSTNHANSCYFGSETADINSVADYNKNKDLYKEAAVKLGVHDVSCLTQIQIVNPETPENESANIVKNAAISIDGVDYQGLPEWKCNNVGNSYETNEFVVSLYDKDCPPFSRLVAQQYGFENPGKAYLEGRLPEQSNELIISNYMLACFGIPQDKQNDMIGRKVSIYYDESVCYCEDYTITGIFDAKILSVREEDNYFPVWGHIIINYDLQTLENRLFHGKSTFRLYGADFDNLEEMDQKKDENLNMEISPLGEIYIIMNKQIGVVNKILQIIMLHFIISILIYVVSIFSFFLERNRSYFVMLCAMGLEKIHLYLIHMFEMLIITILSVICGLYFSVFVLIGLNSLYRNITGFSLLIEPLSLSVSVVMIFVLISIIFGCGSYINCRKIINADVLR